MNIRIKSAGTFAERNVSASLSLFRQMRLDRAGIAESREKKTVRQEASCDSPLLTRSDSRNKSDYLEGGYYYAGVKSEFLFNHLETSYAGIPNCWSFFSDVKLKKNRREFGVFARGAISFDIKLLVIL